MEPTEMLCQDCLRVRPYSDAGHVGDEHCECGGDFCGCFSCSHTISKLRAGYLLSHDLGIKTDLVAWDPDRGAYTNYDDLHSLVINSLFRCESCRSQMLITRSHESYYGLELYCKRCDAVKNVIFSQPDANTSRITTDFALVTDYSPSGELLRNYVID